MAMARFEAVRRDGMGSLISGGCGSFIDAGAGTSFKYNAQTMALMMKETKDAKSRTIGIVLNKIINEVAWRLD